MILCIQDHNTHLMTRSNSVQGCWWDGGSTLGGTQIHSTQGREGTSLLKKSDSMPNTRLGTIRGAPDFAPRAPAGFPPKAG